MDTMKTALARNLQRIIKEGAPVVPPQLDGCHVQVQPITDLVTMLRVHTPSGIRYFEVKMSEKL